jgi:membrane dipeptidase
MEGLINKMKTIDLHCDTILKLYEDAKKGTNTHLAHNALQIDLEKMQAADYLLQNFAMFIDLKETTDAYQTCLAMIACFKAEMALNKDKISQVTTYEEILTNQQAHRLSALLTMEEAAPVAGNLEHLQEFYELGVRMITLTWNYPTLYGYPSAAYWNEQQAAIVTPQHGLTIKGRELVEKMAELGIMIDVSHGSDQLVKDVLATTKVPIVASHSNARAIHPHARNLPDDLIRAIATRGGLIGANYYSLFLNGVDTKKEIDPHRDVLADLTRHILHMRNVGGIECLALGSDFDGCPPSIQLQDVTDVPKLIAYLTKAGLHESEIEKIYAGNALRFYKEML